MSTETKDQWAARVAPTMIAAQWATAETLTRGAWDESCGEWLVWVQRTAPPRGPFNLPPWGLVLAQALLAHRAGHPCEDCDGTGWSSETHPGTGGGTGRDEQIAVECPRGCPEPSAAATMVHVFPNRDGSVTTVMPDGGMLHSRPGALTIATLPPTRTATNWTKSQDALEDLAAMAEALGTPEPTIRSLTCHPAHIEAMRAHFPPEERAPLLPPALLDAGIELYAAEMDRGRGMLTYSDGSTAWIDFATGTIGERQPGYKWPMSEPLPREHREPRPITAQGVVDEQGEDGAF
jgi:hypothetical protein